MQELNSFTKGARRAYKRPTLAKVPLRPEEAVLGNCKTASGGGPNSGTGTTCTLFAPCHDQGS